MMKNENRNVNKIKNEQTANEMEIFCVRVSVLNDDVVSWELITDATKDLIIDFWRGGEGLFDLGGPPLSFLGVINDSPLILQKKIRKIKI